MRNNSQAQLGLGTVEYETCFVSTVNYFSRKKKNMFALLYSEQMGCMARGGKNFELSAINTLNGRS
jgi:hypothetical protein